MPKPSLEGFTPEQIEEMADTYRAVLANPETRKAALRATKKVNPGMSIPEIDLEDAGRAEFKARDERIEKLEDELRRRDAESRVHAERAALRDKGMSAEDIAAVEKLMIDKRIPDYSTAAEFLQNQRQVAEPTPNSMERRPALTVNLPSDPLAALKQGPKGLKNWGRDNASAALDEIRSGKIKLH